MTLQGHEDLANVVTLYLSGTKLQVGYTRAADPTDNTVTLHSDEQAEAIYISPAEARLLRAALTVAIKEAEE